MPTTNRLSLLVSLIMLVLFPFVLTQIAVASLAKLHLSPQTAFQLMMAIIAGGLINIPIRRIVHQQPVWSNPLAFIGLDGESTAWLNRQRHETIIAVNVGGALIPIGIALYQLFYLVPLGEAAIWAVVVAVTINTVVSYLIATPVANVGIVMPGFVAPLTAVLSALILAPEHGPPVAFVAGVPGPLIGADLLHIDEFAKTPTGVASIGGAGTFDGIVLSGILAAYLA